MEIYLSTAGINLPMYYGTMIGPVFGDILLRGLSSLEEKITGKILFNCYSPVFRKEHPEKKIISMIKEREKELSMLRLHDIWQFERDDKLGEKLDSYIDMLFSKGVFYLDGDEALFDISRLKKDVKEKVNKIRFIPEYYAREFREYVKSEGPSQPISGRLQYGHSLKRFGAGTLLSQVWEQAIFSALSDDTKIIISGPNVLGPYSFRAAMLCAYSGNSDIYLAIHSLAKVSNSLKSKLGERGRLSMDYLIQSCSGIVDVSDYLRYTAASAISDKKIVILDENNITRSRKALVKYYNLRKVLDRQDPQETPKSVEECIKKAYSITDKFFKSVHLVSQSYSKKEEIALWKDCVRDAELITGRII